MSINSKNNGLQWVIPFVILFCSWSFLGGWISLFGRLWIWLILGSLSLAFIVPGFFKTKAFFALLLYALVVFINFIGGDEYYKSFIYVSVDVLQFLFFGGVGYYLIHSKDEEQLSGKIMYLALIVIVFTSIGTFFADKIYPNIVRTLVVYRNVGVSCEPYYRLGVCRYDMPHAMPILIPAFILWLKQKQTGRWGKILALIMLLFDLLLIWTSGATTPLLLAVFALGASLVIIPTYNRKKNIGRVLIFLILASPLTMSSVQLNIIHSLGRIIPDENSNKGKLKDFEDRIVYGEEEGGDLKGREDLYATSFEAFVKNPILGTDKLDDLGGHSIILDRLGTLGLVGFIPFILFLWFMIKDAFSNISPHKRMFYIIGVCCFLLMFALKNVSESWMHLAAFILLPIMINRDDND